MLELLQFIFSGFWVWSGTCVLLWLCVLLLWAAGGVVAGFRSNGRP